MTVGVWLKLESNFMMNIPTNKIDGSSLLCTYKIVESTSIQDYFNKFDWIILDLKDVEIIVDDEDLAIMLLILLPKSYENLV